MSSHWRHLIKAADDRLPRVLVATALGVLVWGVFLIVLGRSLFSSAVTERKPERPMEMTLVEVPKPSPAVPTAIRRPVQTTINPQQTTSPLRAPVVSTRAPHRPTVAAPRLAPPVLTARSTASAPATEPRAEPPTTSGAQVTGAAAPSAPSEHEANAAGQTSASPASGSSPARAITQPLPSVPDDLREQAYQTVATAHLVIHVDGSVAVELTKPTQYPRLNQILIETLRTWRFFPAMQGGHPIETQQDVRVHFNVS